MNYLPSDESGPFLLLTKPQAARALGMGERKLWELTNNGVIDSIKMGRSVRYDVRDLIAYVDGLKAEAGDGPITRASMMKTNGKRSDEMTEVSG